MAADAPVRTITLTMAVAIKARSTFVMRLPLKLSTAYNDKGKGSAFLIEVWQPNGLNVA
jgi:hypothetical protein